MQQMSTQEIREVELSAFHRVFRKESQLFLYPEAVKLGTEYHTLGSKHVSQLNNLVNLAEVAITPNDIKKYLENQKNRRLGLGDFFVDMVSKWDLLYQKKVPEFKKEIIACLKANGIEATQLLSFDDNQLFNALFKEFVKHLSAHVLCIGHTEDESRQTPRRDKR